MLATFARLIFAAVLFGYYWTAGLTKIPDGFSNFLSPSFNAFAQIFPRAAAVVGFDVTQTTPFQNWAMLLGTWAEFALPACIVLGLFTRIASGGMIIFIVVQSATDVVGHGATLGALFDAVPDAPLDQRALWLFLLSFLTLHGGGPFAMDRYFFKSERSPYQGDRPQ